MGDETSREDVERLIAAVFQALAARADHALK